jgi:ribulose-5-phosphate 4-epimerase/fuculose-1-phosphate aldolase
MSKPSQQADAASDAEWRIRCDLAGCYRAFAHYGWTDLIYTHVSARHPSEEGHYLINPYGLLFDEITASNLIVVDFDGKVVRGDYPANGAGHPIHSGVLMARPDVNWVLHTHSRAGMAVSCMKSGLLMLTQQAMSLRDHVAYHDWDLQDTAGECEKLARDLGPDNIAMILRNHGLLACGPTIASAFTTLYTLETACKVQTDVVAMGSDWIAPDARAVDRTAAGGGPSGMTGEDEWAAVCRMLDRLDPSYKS